MEKYKLPFKEKVRRFFLYRVGYFFHRMRNIVYSSHIEFRWPWMAIKDDEGNFTEFNWYEDIPIGWRKAFGPKFMNELRNAMDKSGMKWDELRIYEIKEKWGGLRFYVGGATKEVHDVINKYESISYGICIKCGKPATRISIGRVMPYCDKCGKNMNTVLIGENQDEKENISIK